MLENQSINKHKLLIINYFLRLMILSVKLTMHLLPVFICLPGSFSELKFIKVVDKTRQQLFNLCFIKSLLKAN